MDCCKPDYDTVFSEKRAKADLKRYRKKGPDKTTRMLIEALKSFGVRQKTLLDIGGGVGVIDHELIASGVESAVHVEASEASVKAAADEALRRGHQARMTFLRGDFVALSGDIAPADIVTLDRVICCYANMEQLVSTSAARARQLYGVVVPRERTLTNLMRAGINLVFRIIRNPFRFYVHPLRDIDGLLQRTGFALQSVKVTLIWRVAVYEKRRSEAERRSATVS
jgi:2-polyprenyl-3-methyl-5-hydroxy-6-metoxy-1,4-benzoquinol methylase